MTQGVLSNKYYFRNIKQTFECILNEGELSDVTLVTSDNKIMYAHKLILCSFSSFFSEILVNHPHQNPLIYLRGIVQKDLELVLKFIYTGQCEVEKYKIAHFLELANELKIEGLDQDELNIEGLDQDELKMEGLDQDVEQNKKEQLFIEENMIDQKLKCSVPVNHQQIIESYPIKKFEEEQNFNQISPPGLDTYDQFDKDFSMIKELSAKTNFVCDECGKNLSSKQKLTCHKITHHNMGDKKLCTECDFQTGYKDVLMKHIDTSHKNIRYQCDQCDYKATQKGSLKIHKGAQHDGVTFTCENCGKVFKLYSTLAKHIEYKHGERKYKCEECDYIAGQSNHLKAHTSVKHKNIK